MPRNKNTKRNNKSQPKRDILTHVQQMEKTFMQMPAKLSAQLDKEVAAHQRNEAKLTKAVAKTQSALVKTAARAKSAANDAQTAKGKKLLKAAKNTHKETVAMQSNLSKELKNVNKASKPLLDKQAKLAGLVKYLGQFEKHWAQSTKLAKAKTKPKKTKVEKNPSSVTHLVTQPRVESSEVSSHTVEMIDDVTEFAS